MAVWRQPNSRTDEFNRWKSPCALNLELLSSYTCYSSVHGQHGSSRIQKKMPCHCVCHANEAHPWRVARIDMFNWAYFFPRLGLSGRSIAAGCLLCHVVVYIWMSHALQLTDGVFLNGPIAYSAAVSLFAQPYEYDSWVIKWAASTDRGPPPSITMMPIW